MKIVTSIQELDHPTGCVTGFVPTMGAFHEGHLQLMRTARSETDRVVVSLFVNPTQFGQGEDFGKDPRTFERDAQLASEVGVDVLFAPTTSEMYPRTATSIHVPVVTDLWEGEIRPTHFDGVVTIVCKLFNIVQPTIAYFGQKDLQQCLVITRMVEDLNMNLRLSIQPTVRESDGLAMSSRNAYLSAEQRLIAPLIYRELTRCQTALKELSKESQVKDLLLTSKGTLELAGFLVDYLELIEMTSMTRTTSLTDKVALIVAARLGATRLIDNVVI